MGYGNKNVGDISSIIKIRYLVDENNRISPEVISSEEEKEPKDLILKTVRVHIANTVEKQERVNELVSRLYQWRGYLNEKSVQFEPRQLTFTVSENNEVVGTVTTNVDSKSGLTIDDTFPDEAELVRRAGGRIGEFTRLAIGSSIKHKRIFGSLFHVAIVYLRQIRRCTHLLAEINPRHLRFYQSMLGAEQLGDIKVNVRAQAPSILLSLDLAYAESQARMFGGLNEAEGLDKNIYCYFFSPEEEREIVDKLLCLTVDQQFPPKKDTYQIMV